MQNFFKLRVNLMNEDMRNTKEPTTSQQLIMPQAIYMITEDQLRYFANEVAQKILKDIASDNSSLNLLTVEDVCAKFKVNRVTIWRWENDGLLKGKRMGRRKYYATADIARLLESSEWRDYKSPLTQNT